ncbi:hypothetical protein FRX31_005417 [Thalictrum thalictroides]|uniref:Uncharacterized protein n=1 Tax=Thalictrum thalictroides TaxID=46969 RepID=A0A7J6X810_THATH|nr:hypothetical protein FRX31_005417 [Thalictrum thalictroides]
MQRNTCLLAKDKGIATFGLRLSRQTDGQNLWPLAQPHCQAMSEKQYPVCGGTCLVLTFRAKNLGGSSASADKRQQNCPLSLKPSPDEI